MKDPLIISYYTENTLYELEAANLRQSCQKWHLPYFIDGIRGADSWEVNCAIKPRFILECLKAFKRPVIWIDADGEIVQSPQKLLQPEGRFSFLIHDDLPKSHHSKIMSSTLYFDYDPECLKFLSLWASKCENMPHEWDQKHLSSTYFNEGPWEGFFSLPQSYCAIYDRAVANPVILHYQASRLIKKFINQECFTFIDYKNISAEEWHRLRIDFYESVKDPLGWIEDSSI